MKASQAPIVSLHWPLLMHFAIAPLAIIYIYYIYIYLFVCVCVCVGCMCFSMCLCVRVRVGEMKRIRGRTYPGLLVLQELPRLYFRLFLINYHHYK